MQAVVYVEIDVPYCVLTFGTSPCAAVLGTTGLDRCFNSRATCQDVENFDPADVTMRFAVPAAYLPTDIEALPIIDGVQFTPGTIGLGDGLGQRASLSVTFWDRPHSDVGPGFDKYRTLRSYDPYSQGTLWGKFRARQPYMRGQELRIYRGLLGQTLAQMDVRHYVIEGFQGPTPDGKYTLTAKDVLKLADGDRAQAPLLSNGFIVSDIAIDATELQLSPAGIGDLEYPASGVVNIAGKEIAVFTRVADILTLTSRGYYGTEASAHEAGDRVQLVLEYVGKDPAFILHHLLTNYADVSEDYITVADWNNEVDTYLARNYTGVIAEPTAVRDLVAEVCQQAGLAFWWDDALRQIQLRVLRGVPSTSELITEDNVIAGSMSVAEQPDKRISQVWLYFAQRNPLEPQDNTDNYRSTVVVIDADAEDAHGIAAVKKVYCRWIPLAGRTTAQRAGELLLQRFAQPPRRFTFDKFRPGRDEITLGSGYRISTWHLQTAFGGRADVPVQVVRLNPLSDRWAVEAEEVNFQELAEEFLAVHSINLDVSANNLNLRTLHDSLYPEITQADVSGGVVIVCTIATNAIIGSTSVGVPALEIGLWDVAIPITLVVNGRIQGRGGNGGGANSGDFLDGAPGQVGGVALYARQAITLVNNGGIWGGGGGGGGGTGPGDVGSDGLPAGGGGGGAGKVPGSGGPGAGGGPGGNPGTVTAPGAAGAGTVLGGDGGGPGLAGTQGASSHHTHVGGLGGQPGAAVDGISYVTVSVAGDRRGPEIN
jgi:hypothetical protein